MAEKKAKGMTDKAKKKIIANHRSPVICPGCGKVIAEKEDLGKVEYVRTKRATDVFFHTACMEKVWR